MMPVPRRPKRATDPKAVAPPDGAHKKPPPGPLELAENGASQPHLPVANGAATPHEIAATPVEAPAAPATPGSARPDDAASPTASVIRSTIGWNTG